jgi:hypothetical protein
MVNKHPMKKTNEEKSNDMRITLIKKLLNNEQITFINKNLGENKTFIDGLNCDKMLNAYIESIRKNTTTIRAMIKNV